MESNMSLPYCGLCNQNHAVSGYCPARQAQGEADVEAGRTKPMAEVMKALRARAQGEATAGREPVTEPSVETAVETRPVSATWPSEAAQKAADGVLHCSHPTAGVVCNLCKQETAEALARAYAVDYPTICREVVLAFAEWLNIWPRDWGCKDEKELAERFLQQEGT